MGFRACSNLLLRWGVESFQWSLLSPLDSIELPSPLQSNPRSFSLSSDQFSCFMKWENGGFHRLFGSIAEPTQPVLPSSQSLYSPSQSMNANLKSDDLPSKPANPSSSTKTATLSSSMNLSSSTNPSKPSSPSNSSYPSNPSNPSTLSTPSSLGWSIQNTSHRLYNPIPLSLIYFAPILSLFHIFIPFHSQLRSLLPALPRVSKQTNTRIPIDLAQHAVVVLQRHGLVAELLRFV